ncbi:uncharacterized protein LOC143106639 isoform X2 [Alosa pseudoharengus]|uniref:uncharacterized protein LOC143106639 isoform X2 n=1 Tax=Alosa pseudoharengus TaxID=34774 RepID=UPI003F8C6E4A
MLRVLLNANPVLTAIPTREWGMDWLLSKVYSGEDLKTSMHDMSIVEEELNENTFNDPMNSVIDWPEEGPSFHGERDDSSDEEYLPPISLHHFGLEFCIMFATFTTGKREAANTITLKTFRVKNGLKEIRKSHKALVDIVLNKRWQKEVHKYLRFRSTAHLESFQNHILMYASKRQAFTPRVYDSRVLLAALDYNFHRERPTYRTAEGQQVFRKKYNKNARRYSLYALKCEKSYGYIHELQARILKGRVTSGVGMPRKRTLLYARMTPSGLVLCPRYLHHRHQSWYGHRSAEVWDQPSMLLPTWRQIGQLFCWCLRCKYMRIFFFCKHK